MGNWYKKCSYLPFVKISQAHSFLDFVSEHSNAILEWYNSGEAYAKDDVLPDGFHYVYEGDGLWSVEAAGWHVAQAEPGKDRAKRLAAIRLKFWADRFDPQHELQLSR